MKLIAQYSCSQSALYRISQGVLFSFNAEIKAFSGFKTKYTAEYSHFLANILSEAENIPDFHFLLSKSETNYRHLCNALSECTIHWQKLKRYIKTAYAPEEYKTRLEQAGSDLYKKAVARNWQSANAMLMAAKNFLNNQSVILQSNQNMPQTFISSFNQTYNNFSKCLLNFQQSEREIKTGTDQKLKANNHLFMLITEICQDGQLIFRNNQAVRQQFIFNSILKTFGTTKQKVNQHTDISISPESLLQNDTFNTF